MNILARQIIIITAILPPFILLALSSLSFLALAQEPSSFEISIIPQADYAVAGQPFAYTITITNVSQTPLKNVAAKIQIPEGAALVDVHNPSLKWAGGMPGPGRSVEEITVFTFETVVPGEVFTFELVVKVLEETGQQQIVNKDYTVTVENKGVVASGPPIKTEILISSPTPTSLPTATTTVPSVTPTGTPTSQATTEIITTPQDITPLAQVDTGISYTATPISALSTQDTVEERPLSTTTAIVGSLSLLVLIVVIIGVIWFIKRK